MNDIDKNRKRPNFVINHPECKAEKLARKRQEVLDPKVEAFLAGGGKITKIKTGVSSYTEMSVKAASKKKGKAAFDQNMKEEIHCKGCTAREGKPMKHPKSEFTHRPDMTRLFESTCRVEKLRRDKESARKRRNC